MNLLGQDVGERGGVIPVRIGSADEAAHGMFLALGSAVECSAL